MIHHCEAAGCPETTEQPMKDGWTYFGGFEDDSGMGFYCRHHAEALNAFLYWELEDMEATQ
jgi:hypothetical protein